MAHATCETLVTAPNFFAYTLSSPLKSDSHLIAGEGMTISTSRGLPAEAMPSVVKVHDRRTTKGGTQDGNAQREP